MDAVYVCEYGTISGFFSQVFIFVVIFDGVGANCQNILHSFFSSFSCNDRPFLSESGFL